ncbi:MAG: amidase family protein, partial [Pseudomonadota bacterium]
MRPTERLDLYRQRIVHHDDRVHAFLDLRWDHAEAEVRAADERLASGKSLSPIDGYCVAVKANIAVQGLPCHAGIEA